MKIYIFVGFLKQPYFEKHEKKNLIWFFKKWKNADLLIELSPERVVFRPGLRAILLPRGRFWGSGGLLAVVMSVDVAWKLSSLDL